MVRVAGEMPQNLYRLPCRRASRGRASVVYVPRLFAFVLHRVAELQWLSRSSHRLFSLRA